MSLSSRISEAIQSFPEDYTFRYADLPINKEEYASSAKVLERLQTKGLIKKLSKGIFYKPEQSVFGELKPNENEVLKDYLFEEGKRVAYLTGVYLYNQMMLTTQVPAVWKVASFNKRIFINRANLKATAVKSYVPITDENYQLLGFLDALKDWNRIPDMDKTSGLAIVSNRLNQFSTKEINDLIEFALAYPPRVQAFLGALLELLKIEIDLAPLKKQLNPLTEYKLGVNQLSTASNWNIA